HLLERCESPNRPDEQHLVRLGRLANQRHARLFRRLIALPVVAARAGSDAVRPCVLTATRPRNHVVTSKELPGTELALVTPAVLTRPLVASEQEGFGHPPTVAARNVDVTH